MLRGSRVMTLVLALAVPSTAFAAPKVGVVEVQKVMEAIPAWNKAVELLRKEFDKKKVELEARQTDLQKKKDQIEAKRMVTDPKAIAEEEQKFMATANDFRNEFMQAQQDISMREGALKEAMLARIEKAVSAVGERDEYDYIVEAGPETAPNVLYAAKSALITQATIESYKKLFGDQELKLAIPPAGAPGMPGMPGGMQRQAPQGPPKK